jgi:hypothetical protein
MPKPKFMPKAMGPKTSFNWEIGDVIIERLAQGESLRAITKDPAMPSLATVLKWVANDVEGFAKPYNEARVAQAHAWAEDILEIIDDSSGDYVVGADGRREFNSEHVQRSKLRYEGRRWLASKALPRIYGDRNMTEISGPGGAPIPLVQVEDSTPSIRLLLQQCLAAEPKVVDVAADEDTTDRFPKTADGRPRLSE